jgi:hypothetical protein
METYEDIIENRVDLMLAIPKWLFNVTLGINTVLFLMALINIDNEFLVTIGFFCVVIVLVINAITFLSLIIFSFIYKFYQRSIIINSLILLANIPIALLYMFIIVHSVLEIIPIS